MIKKVDNFKLECMISQLLKWGIWIACLITVIGGLFYLYHEGKSPIEYQIFVGEPAFLTSMRGAIRSTLAGNPEALIQVGVILLIATPLARVIACFSTFLSHREWLYVPICLITLLVLLSSLLGLYS